MPISLAGFSRILITAVDDYEAAVQAVKAGGATDYIRKITCVCSMRSSWQ